MFSFPNSKHRHSFFQNKHWKGPQNACSCEGRPRPANYFLLPLQPGISGTQVLILFFRINTQRLIPMIWKMGLLGTAGGMGRGLDGRTLNYIVMPMVRVVAIWHPVPGGPISICRETPPVARKKWLQASRNMPLPTKAPV
jgi:hypothetical protein